MPEFELSYAEKIFLVRKRLGQTQEEFARRFNVQKLAVTQWESGGAEPRDERHRALLVQLFRDVLHEEDDSTFETAAYQLNLPFDEPIKVDFRVLPIGPGRVRLGVQIKRRAS
jgi:transcriptional regulator with XRE-family HTH domain